MPKDSKSLNKFKFEANMTVFGTDVDLKPMENSEIGYRAGPGETGIEVTKEKLVSAKLVDKNGPAYDWIPAKTTVKTIIYDYKKTKMEMAVLADFQPGKIPADILASELESHENEPEKLTYLKEEAEKRGFKCPTDKKKAADQIAWYKNQLEDQPADSGFILNRYPQAFTVNSLFLYVNLEKQKKVEDAS